MFIELKAAFAECEFFELNVAFISYSGLQIMLDLLQAANDRGVKGQKPITMQLQLHTSLPSNLYHELTGG